MAQTSCYVFGVIKQKSTSVPDPNSSCAGERSGSAPTDTGNCGAAV